jgi:hypothetical protein
MYDAWHWVKGKPTISGKRVTAQESFFQGYMDTSQRNPSPSALLSLTWKKAQVRRLPSGKVQIKVTRAKGRR